MKKILLAINYVKFKDPEKAHRQDVAMKLLEQIKPSNVDVMSFNYPDEDFLNKEPKFLRMFKQLQTDASKSFGTPRRLPLVKEIFDICGSMPYDLFGYMNSDILVNDEFFKTLNDTDFQTYVFSRIDISKVNVSKYLSGEYSSQGIYPEGIHDGADAFFFKADWWKRYGNKFHDHLILGEAFWDWYYRKQVINYTKKEDRCFKHCLHHVYHDTEWSEESVGGKHNNRIWKDIENIRVNQDNIPLKFGLFWSGTSMSYLRYLTFKSLRHFHPNAEIELYVADKCKKDGFKWQGGEKQDFLKKNELQDYIGDLKDLNVKVIEKNLFPDYPPNFQSDLFRWWWLSENGGFYLDTDQIILKSFNNLPREHKIIYSRYHSASGEEYSPVGVIGANDSAMVRHILKIIHKYYNKNVYNSLGPYMFIQVLREKAWREGINIPKEVFYPVAESFMINELYAGKVNLSACKKAVACHWFGGHPISQEFNEKYTEEFAQKSNDSISIFLKKNAII